jgi:membrane associated rhomboid family serine protease
LALWPLGSGNFMPWQLITYAFLHADIGHIFFNMLGLWMFGSELERLWGGKRFLQFMAAGVLSAAACQLIISPIFGSFAPTIGISGGLFALLLAYGMLFPDRTIMPLFPHPDEGAHLRAGVRPDRTGHGRGGHDGRGPLRPPGRHAGRLADDPLLARPAPFPRRRRW